TAPLHYHWLTVLYDLLDAPGFQPSPKKIDTVLSHWAKLDDKVNENSIGGHFTLLSLKDEFRCLIAALYGRTYSNNKFADAADVAMRCAYYGNAKLSERQMKAGYDRDGSEYVFAAMYNSNILYDNKLRKFFEQEQLTFHGNLWRRYLRNFELKRKANPY